MHSALSIFVVCFRWILSTSRMLTISPGEGIYTGYQLNIIYGDFLIDNRLFLLCVLNLISKQEAINGLSGEVFGGTCFA
jgi:hypothetical protein